MPSGVFSSSKGAYHSQTTLSEPSSRYLNVSQLDGLNLAVSRRRRLGNVEPRPVDDETLIVASTSI
jgi:hypothetical protein